MYFFLITALPTPFMKLFDSFFYFHFRMLKTVENCVFFFSFVSCFSMNSSDIRSCKNE